MSMDWNIMRHFRDAAGDTEPSAATMVFLIEKAKDENVRSA